MSTQPQLSLRTIAPYPSLVAKLLPQIRDLEEQTRAALSKLDDIPNWDAAELNHEPLLKAVADIKTQIADWKKCMETQLKSMWFKETQAYNSYTREMERALNIRHSGELGSLFPSLRTVATAIEPSLAAEDTEEAMCRQHMLRFGFSFVSSSARLSALCLKQIREAQTLSRVVQAHCEKLLAAQAADTEKLDDVLQGSLDRLDALIQAVERKISESHHTAAFAIYRRRKTSDSAQKTDGAPLGASVRTASRDYNLPSPSSYQQPPMKPQQIHVPRPPGYGSRGSVSASNDKEEDA